MSNIKPEVKVEYLSTGANRQTAVADWGESGVLAFGADTNIALWSPTSVNSADGITCLLGGHTDAVKAVKFIKSSKDANSLLISGSDDKTLKLWSVSPDLRSATCMQTVQEHTAPINTIAVLRTRKTERASPLLATGAADATIRIWSLSADDQQLHLLQTIRPTPKFFPLSLAFSTLDESDDGFVLAAAGTRDLIQLFVSGSDGSDTGTAPPLFELQATLTGHEGWIRSLDFTWENDSPESDLLLASASQDKYVRLWRLHQGKELPSLAVESDPSSGAFLPGKSPSNKAHWLKASGRDFSATFEALLLGHEDWIYSAKWLPRARAGGKLQLLSTSADNTLAMWESDPASGIWVSMVRLGEISREKGATTATGSIGGFWTGLWSPDGKSVVCLGRTGSWRRWVFDDENDLWQPALATSGHTRAVTGISWTKDGRQLLSTSSDQTTRLHGQWKSTESAPGTWHEMSRPQIHGYDLNCIDTLGASQFVSGADEKLMRVFSKPKAVARLLNKLQGADGTTVDANHQSQTAGEPDLPDGANMPVLGLSNKAVETGDDEADVEADHPQEPDAVDPASVVRKSALDIDHPPLEENLSRHTLWPEVEKLYGHGYELSCLAASHDGKLIASACRASSVNHAVIRLFETTTWTEVRSPLAAHSLTATRLRFSEDDRYLLSVGRDRQWAVFQRSAEDLTQYALLQANVKGHSRMILDAAWAPTSATGRRVFATAGRDKRLRVWKSDPAGEQGGDKVLFSQAAEIKFEVPVTAIDFLSKPSSSGSLVLATGTETGRLSIHLLNHESLEVITSTDVQQDLCLPKPVLQLAWRPVSAEGESGQQVDYKLAIAGEDSSLRLYSFPGLAARQ